MGYEVLTSSRQHFDLATGLLWMPESKFDKIDKEILKKIVKASILAARDMQTLSYNELKKIMMGDHRLRSIPIIAHSYESEENFTKFRNNVIWYTPSLAKTRAMKFPVIFRKMIVLQKETGKGITASYDQIIKFDNFFSEIASIQKKSRKE